MKSKIVAGIVVIVIVIAVVGGFLYADSSSLFAKKGSMQVGVADIPAVQTGVSGVFMTFNKISLHNNVSGWVNYSISEITVNILNVSMTNPSIIGNLSLKAGTYTSMRLYLNNVSVVFLGISINFTIAAHFAIVNHPFVVKSSGTLNVVVDFNLTSSLNMNAKMFTPYVGTVSTTTTAS